MKDILRKSPIERLCVSVSITPQEMALALAGLNPLTRISDVPEEHFDYVDHTRRAIARALKVHRDKKFLLTRPVTLWIFSWLLSHLLKKVRPR